MKRITTRYLHRLFLTCTAALIAIPFANAADQPLSFVGKDEWLFYRVEFSNTTDEAATNTSIDLIRRLNKVLATNGVTMAFTMVPLKARIYAEHLPDDVKINSYMEGNYDRMENALRAGQVSVIDLNQPFLNSPLRGGDTPFFFRLDTHWAPTGAMLAGETIGTEINAHPALKKALDATPEIKFGMAWAKHKVNSTARGQVDGLPKGSPTFGIEQELPFTVTKEQTETPSLLGEGSDAEITLMGSSYSAPWYLLPDALRYTLQREVLGVSVEATHGSWVGMESYLRDDSFQTRKPKLLIWEMPERDMRMPPDYPYREERYHSDNTEWLLRAAAWAQSKCTPSPAAAKIVSGGLAVTEADHVSTGKTGDRDFIEVNFSKPIEKLDYIVASVATSGSKKLVLEASGTGVETRWFDVPVPGNGTEHALKSPLPSDGKGFTKLRIFPGKSSAFTFKGLQVCRQPDDLLK